MRSGGAGGRDSDASATTGAVFTGDGAAAPSRARPVTLAPGRPIGPRIASPLPTADAQPSPGPSLVSVVPEKSAGVSASGGGGGGASGGGGAGARAAIFCAVLGAGFASGGGGAGGGGFTVTVISVGGRLRGFASARCQVPPRPPNRAACAATLIRTSIARPRQPVAASSSSSAISRVTFCISSSVGIAPAGGVALSFAASAALSFAATSAVKRVATSSPSGPLAPRSGERARERGPHVFGIHVDGELRDLFAPQQIHHVHHV